MNKKVLCIIVTYNGMKWIDKCLSSVINSSIPVDLFIIDNGSTDGTIEYITQNYPEVNFVKSKENLGFGRANNLGLKYGLENNYDYVYLLNQDAWIDNNTISSLVKASITNPEFGILTPLQVNRAKSKIDSNFVPHIPSTLASDLLCHNEVKQIYEIKAAMAAHWLITQSCIKEVGGFSPAFKHYGEDDNYLQRAKYKKYKIGVIPQVFGIHDREDRSIDDAKKKYLHYVNNLIILNNPLIKHRFLRILKNNIAALFLSPVKFSIKYFYKNLKEYRAATKYRQKYNSLGVFLN